MPATPEDLFARFEELGIQATTHRHPPVFTVDEARRHCAHLPGAHCKSLFLKDKKGRLWLVVARDSQEIDLKALQKALGAARLSFGKPELLLEVLGITPGSVTPFSLMNDRDHRVTVVLDKKMMASELLNYHPLSNEATTALSPQHLLHFITASGHTPTELDLDTL